MTPLTRRVLLGLAAAPAAGLLLAALAPTGWWPAGLALHWAPQLALLTLPLWCWAGRRTGPGIAITVLVAAALWPWLLAAYAPRAAAPEQATAATAMSANLYYRNRDHHAALNALAGELVVLIETVPEDRERLRDDPRWPHQRWLTPRGFGGMALLSRWPMRATELDLDEAPGIDARVQAPWGPLRVVAIHTWSPSDPRSAMRNRRQLDELAGLAATEPGPLLVLGDLNATHASPGLRALRSAGLRPAHGGGPATWPAFLGPAGIAIDHALVRSLGLGGATTVDLPGSDHRGVAVRFGPY